MKTKTKSIVKKTNPAVRAAAFEALEGRQLMSVSMNAGTDTLTVTGSNAVNDQISLQYVPFPNNLGQLLVTENGKLTFNGLVATHTTVRVNGLDGDDTIDCTNVSRDVVIDGGWGNDTLRGGAGNDSMIGGIGADAMFGNGGNDWMYGGDANDTLDGGAGDDWLQGDGADDTLRGGSGNDYVAGGAGDDVVDGGIGDDAIWGGPGWDLVDYGSRTQPLYITVDDVKNDGEGPEWDNVHTDVERIMGGMGNDVIVGSAADNYIYGNGGTDNIHGGEGKDVIFGGLSSFGLFGNTGFDVIYGDGGDDQLWTAQFGSAEMHGGNGNDILFGGQFADKLYGDADNDQIYGGAGNDEIYGGTGDDDLRGGEGDDTIVSIGGGTADTLTGDGGSDSFWLDDAPAEHVADITPDESDARHEHRVAGFHNYEFSTFPAWYKGPGTVKVAVGKEPLGENLPDPYTSYGYQNFSKTPLFPAAGVQANDIVQGKIGDCWFASALSSAASNNPDLIKQSVVSLGDGTYAARLVINNQYVYYRVDGDLPVDGNGNLVYLHKAGGGIYAAILEKALAFARVRQGTYNSIAGGSATDGLRILSGDDIGVGTWVGTSSDGKELLQDLHDLLQNGNSIVFGTIPNCDGLPLVGAHAYSVVSVQTDAAGHPLSVTLRNPWGVDGGGNVDNNPNDGMVTLNANQAWNGLLAYGYARV